VVGVGDDQLEVAFQDWSYGGIWVTRSSGGAV